MTKPAPSGSVRTINPRFSARRRRRASRSLSLKMPKPEVSTITVSTIWERVFLS
ncbi:Uncharacterised protein [Flavonifractor plautii]|uniref:Uncharacterized protein n=1 Tax=Flavonifractor plautii TaxID=292800 RepID=A0A174QPY4_FLAPL|nr:Uncharacterised protein [Flavonifractor plautii]